MQTKCLKNPRCFLIFGPVFCCFDVSHTNFSNLQRHLFPSPSPASFGAPRRSSSGAVAAGGAAAAAAGAAAAPEAQPPGAALQQPDARDAHGAGGRWWNWWNRWGFLAAATQNRRVFCWTVFMAVFCCEICFFGWFNDVNLVEIDSNPHVCCNDWNCWWSICWTFGYFW